MKCFHKLLLSLVCCLLFVDRMDAAVKLERLPAGGVQPQSVVDKQGTVHVVYLAGEAGASDVYYIFRKAGESKFSQPLKVNSQSGSAVATGTIRGAQVAVAPGGVVHVLWNGGMKALPKQGEWSPLLYARLSPGQKGFEPQRNLMKTSYALDGGGSITVDAQGKVYVAWHASRTSPPKGESGRAVFLVASQDEGKTFSAEREISPPKSGTCACCGLRLAVDDQNHLNVLFRAVFTAMDRDMVWLQSKDAGQTFELKNRDSWKIGQCPMSTAWFRDGWLAWESEAKVKFARETTNGMVEISPAGNLKRKNPVAVTLRDGSGVLIWTEGTAWNKGGAVCWQSVGKDGMLLAKPESRLDLPVWGLATAWVEASGNDVVILY